MRKIIISFFVVGFLGFTSMAQGGMEISAGLTGMTNQSSVLVDGGPIMGYHAGADLKMMEGDMTFILGGRYTQIDFTNNEELYVSEQPVMQIINTRIGLGFKLFKITEKLLIRGKFLGSIDYVFNSPLGTGNRAPGMEEYANVNSTASLIGGLGIGVGSIFFDVEYGYGLFNLISMKKETTPTYVSASVGFSF